jgi:protein TonB
MSEPSHQTAGGQQDSVELPPAPEAVSIDFSAAEGMPKSAQRRLWSLSLAAAFSAHALILLIVSWHFERGPVGAGGQELEAIAIEIVSAKALESRVSGNESTPAPPERVDHSVPGSTPSEASVATLDQKPIQSEAETQSPGPKPDLIIPEAKPEEPPPEPAEIALAVADKAPDHPIPQEPEPEDKQQPESQPEAADPSRASEASEASDEGGSAARGIDAIDTSGQQAAAASAGIANEYAKTIIETLARRKPRAIAGVRGTVRISFTVGQSGEVREARISRSSGQKVLDEAALSAVRSAKFPVPPPALANGNLSYEVPYIFR